MNPLRRRALLSLALSGGALAACTSSEPEPTPTTSSESPTPTQTPTATGTPDASTDPSFVPEGLEASQRTEFRYGDHYRQVSDLWLPADGHRDAVVVLVHGGGWDATTDRRNVNDLVAALVGQGWPVLSADYRGNGDGGGWTGTFTDTATAVDMAAEAADRYSLPTDRVCFVGHSAGGHLAMWAAARGSLGAGEPGADPRVVPAFAASMSGVLHPTPLGFGADVNVQTLFGGTPDEVGDRYTIGDPVRRVPYGFPLFVSHGTGDLTVPHSQSEAFAGAATAAGDTVELHLLDGVSHEDPLDPGGQSFPLFTAWLESNLG
ncbi:alpha/beta hydrolase family protein [Kineococcus sp. SYSU DK003]|uniref:alpha/beta hydrolase family protein n=1 Tax=Kineococcus sp. SYSU DK003 TaxID=3383124 RepID=UPI003D7E0149